VCKGHYLDVVAQLVPVPVAFIVLENLFDCFGGDLPGRPAHQSVQRAQKFEFLGVFFAGEPVHEPTRPQKVFQHAGHNVDRAQLCSRIQCDEVCTFGVDLALFKEILFNHPLLLEIAGEVKQKSLEMRYISVKFEEFIQQVR